MATLPSVSLLLGDEIVVLSRHHDSGEWKIIAQRAATSAEKTAQSAKAVDGSKDTGIRK